MWASGSIPEGLNLTARLHEVVRHEDHLRSPCDCQPLRWPAVNPTHTLAFRKGCPFPK